MIMASAAGLPSSPAAFLRPDGSCSGRRSSTASIRVSANCAMANTLPPGRTVAGSKRTGAVGAHLFPLRRSVSKTFLHTARGRTQLRAAPNASWAAVDVEEGKTMLDRQGYKFLDLRSEREFDLERLTKPARCSINVPLCTAEGGIDPTFQARVFASLPRSAKALVATAEGGDLSQAAMQILLEGGYSNVVEVKGGYAAWSQVFTTSGRRKPPAGRWVSTGREALKSGLNVGDVALSYDEGGNASEARWAKGLADDAGDSL